MVFEMISSYFQLLLFSFILTKLSAIWFISSCKYLCDTIYAFASNCLTEWWRSDRLDIAQDINISGVESDKEMQSWLSAFVKNSMCLFEWTTEVKYDQDMGTIRFFANCVNYAISSELIRYCRSISPFGPFAIPTTIQQIFLGPYSNSVLSPVFRVESYGKPLKFRLDLSIDRICHLRRLFPSMFGNTDTDVFMRINVCPLLDIQNSLWITGTLSIFSSNLKQTILGNFEKEWIPLQKEPIPVNFPDKVLLYKVNELNTTDTLFICCEIKVYDLSTLQPRHSVDFTPAKIVLLQNLLFLYETREHSDFLIRVNGEEFRAHKAVLKMRSPVFATMFQHDMLENNQNCVEITDFDAKTINEMLRFVYTGESELDTDMAEDLLSLSDKYAIDSLKTVCEDFLITNITVETVLRILNLADMHVALKLKEHCMDFICDYASDVINTDSWKYISMGKPVLIVEVFTALARRQKSSKSN